MNTQQQSQIIQVSLLKWVSILAKKAITSFQQLSTGDLYINLLSEVRQFKFIKPLKDIVENGQQQSYNLANRISNMKVIGDSILRFYQTHMMKDVSGVRIDYVQLCMGNRSQAIKLFSLVVGVIGQTENNMGSKNLLQSIQNLQPQDQDIVKALLENSRNIGQCIAKRQQSPLKKRMLTKLEIYEDKIQTLQLQLQTIKQELEQQKLSSQSLQIQVKQLKLQKSKLIQKVQVLQLLNSRLQSQNSSFMLQNQNLIRKLQSQRRHYDNMLTKNQQTLINYEKQISVVNLMKQKIQQLKSANNELKERMNQIIKQHQDKETKFNLMKDNYKLVQQNCVKTQEKLNLIQLEYQNYRFQQQKCSAMKGTAKLLNSPAYHISNNSQLSSINYRVKDRLGSFIKAQLSQVQMVDSNIVHRQRDTSGSNSKKSILSENQHGLMSSHLQNFSHFALNSLVKNGNLRDIQDVSEFDGENSCQNYKINQQQLDKSLIIGEEEEEEILIRNNSLLKSHIQQAKIKQNHQENIFYPQEHENNYDQQQYLLITMVETLYSQNERLKQQLKKYQTLKYKKQHRLQVFKQKLSKIRQIQSISEIDTKFQERKENISQNGFPILLMTQKQNKHQKDHTQQDSSQRYSYYPLVLN